jgi:CheY-like chemotaxis protein/HPt (histidine-containing phosphotransfer) domain-containing protein
MVMLTSTIDHRRQAREAGIDICMAKPVRRDRLRSALLEALGVHQGRDREASPAQEDLDSPAILVAEDNDVNQVLAARMLEGRGYSPTIVADGRQALDALAHGKFAAVFMDCQMPELNGYEATEELRRRERDGHTPVIAMTAHAMRGDREKCLASGMDDYLAKPLRPDELDAVLRQWAPRAAVAGDNGGGEAPGGAPDGPVRGALDGERFAALRRELGPSGALPRLVAIFERETPAILAGLRSAIDAEEAPSVRDLAHKLKGGCLSITAVPMSELCRDLEESAAAGSLEGAHDRVDAIESAYADALAALREQIPSD